MNNSNRRFLLQSMIIIMLGMVYYGNTLKNQYALDDAIVITENRFTQQGFEGIRNIFLYDSFTGFFGEEKQLVTGGRYRPLSIATLAVEYELFGLNPGVSHAINLIIYILTVWLILYFLSLVFPSKHIASFAFLSALFFLIHPVHSEVVTNIKGRDELLAFLFGFSTLIVTWFYLQKPAWYKLGVSGFLFFLGLLSKENAVVFLMLTPLFFYYFRKDYPVKELVTSATPLLVFFFVFMLIRARVLGDVNYTSSELMNNPFVDATGSQKTGTILLTLGIYFKLLVFPHPLTYDYYPYHIPLTDIFSPLPVIILLIYLFLAGYAVYTLYSRQKTGYAILFYLIPLAIVANILFPIGTFMNERFLYFSSFGFCLLLGQAFVFLLHKPVYRIPAAILLVLAIFFSGWKTIFRNKVWYDDYTLFTHDIQISKNSAKGNVTAGGAKYERAIRLPDSPEKSELLNKSIRHLQRALHIHPSYADAMLLLGNAYWERDNNLDSTLYYYNALLKTSPGNQDVINNLKAIAAQVNNPQQKVNLYRNIILANPSDFDANYKLGNIYGKDLQQLDSAMVYLEKALKIQPENIDALLDMGVAWGMAGDFERSLSYLLRAHELDPDDKRILTNIGVTFQRMGNMEEARKYFFMLEQQK